MASSFFGYSKKVNKGEPKPEKIPAIVETAILGYNSSKEIKSGDIVPYSSVISNNIGLSLNKNGSFNLPKGSYIVMFELRCRSKENCESLITLNVGSNVLYYNSGNLSSESSRTITGVTSINVPSVISSFSMNNSGKESIIGDISENSPAGKLIIIKIS